MTDFDKLCGYIIGVLAAIGVIIGGFMEKKINSNKST